MRMMPSIKFSHQYPKLHNQTTAQLLAIRILAAQSVNRNKSLIEYDTKFFDLKNNGYGYYELPQIGSLIQLIFVGDKEIPFCTLRRWTPDKVAYYKSLIGTTFKIEITS